MYCYQRQLVEWGRLGFAPDNIVLSGLGEFPGEEWNKDNVEFQSLAAMYGHDAYGICGLWGSNRFVFAFTLPEIQERFSVGYATLGKLVYCILKCR